MHKLQLHCGGVVVIKLIAARATSENQFGDKIAGAIISFLDSVTNIGSAVQMSD